LQFLSDNFCQFATILQLWAQIAPFAALRAAANSSIFLYDMIDFNFLYHQNENIVELIAQPCLQSDQEETAFASPPSCDARRREGGGGELALAALIGLPMRE
jgi:hypothetical protein